jgi:hypothetical protein
VHGLIVGPTEKPVSGFSFNNTLFNRNDFPVLYFPTKDIIPMFLYSGLLKISFASSVIINSIYLCIMYMFNVLFLLLSEYITNGTALPCLFEIKLFDWRFILFVFNVLFMLFFSF